MSNVRVTYSGLVGFAVSLVSLFTGILFVILVTRKLSQDEFGFWILIGSLIVYVVILEPIVNYWTTRQIARGENIGSTSLSINGSISIGAILIFLALISYLSPVLNLDFEILLLASFLVPLSFLNSTLGAICAGFRPQATSFGTLSFSISKVVFGFVLVFSFESGLSGIILAVIFANCVRFVVLFSLSKTKIFSKFKIEVVKFWMKLSWLSLYKQSTGFIRSLDVLVFSLFTHSVLELSYWGAANVISSKIGQLGGLYQGLIPKLLAKGRKEFAEENLKLILFFAIPFLAAAIIFAKPGLHILNPIYTSAATIAIILSSRAFVSLFTKFAFSIIEAYERIDEDKQASPRKYIKSKLFFLSTLSYIGTGLYVGILTIFLIFSENFQYDIIDKIIVWSLIYFFISIPFMVYGLWFIWKKYKIKFPFLHTLKYSGVSLIVSIIAFYLMEYFVTYSESIWEFLPQFLPILILSIALYLGITYLVDSSTKKLLRSIINSFSDKNQKID